MNMESTFKKLDLVDNNKRRWLFGVVIGLIIISWFGFFDKLSSDYIDSSLVQATVAFGIARLFNALVSVMQSTTLEFAIISVSVGEVLDPLNDLVEQYSQIMKLAI